MSLQDFPFMRFSKHPEAFQELVKIDLGLKRGYSRRVCRFQLPRGDTQ